MEPLRELSTVREPVDPLEGVVASRGNPNDALETCLDDIGINHPDIAQRSAIRDCTHAVLAPYDGSRMLRLLTGQVVSVLEVDGAGVSLVTGDRTHLQHDGNRR